MRSWAIKQLPRGNPTGRTRGGRSINCKLSRHVDRLNKTVATLRWDSTDTVMVARSVVLLEVTTSVDSATIHIKTNATKAEVAAWVNAGPRANS